MASEKHQNIILLVWDSCRLDTIKENANYLNELSKSNIWFENAVAPANWTFPSHTSIFTGEYPHEHGVCTKFDSLRDVSSLNSLGSAGYDMVGITQNPFVGESYNWDEYFDSFFSTWEWGYDDGIDLSQVISNESTSGIITGIISNFKKYPIRNNTYNIYRALLTKAINEVGPLQDLSHPIFDLDSPYHQDPSDNTRYIKKKIRSKSSSDHPFFIFANYMQPHAPYVPSNYRSISNLNYKQMKEMNEKYKGMTATKTIDENKHSTDEIKTIRNLYRETVSELDTALEQIVRELNKQNIGKETLIIITGDHGESLGEKDARGKVRFGHADTISDDVYKVPLVIAHPKLNTESVSEHISIKNIANILSGGVDKPDVTNSSILNSLLTDEQAIISESPADLRAAHYQREGYPEEFIQSQALEHTVIGYKDDWKVIIRSNDELWAWKQNNQASINDAPSHLIDECENALSQLPKIEESGLTDSDMPDQIQSKLKDLGYL